MQQLAAFIGRVTGFEDQTALKQVVQYAGDLGLVATHALGDALRGAAFHIANRLECANMGAGKRQVGFANGLRHVPAVGVCDLLEGVTE